MCKIVKISLVALLLGVMLPWWGAPASAQSSWKERWREHREADPLVLTGTLGASISDQWSNSEYSSSPLALAAYANLNFKLYGFNIPLNFNFLDVSANNLLGDLKGAIPRPNISLGITPTLGKWKFHAGYSALSFSNYIYSGMQFIGGGIEYGGTFHFGAFAGLLNRPTRFRELDERSALQQYADSLLGLNTYQTQTPQFRRDAIGAKIGVGSDRNFFDLMFLKAKDDPNSLPLYIPYADSTILRDSLVVPKENLAIGAVAHFSIGSWFSFALNGAASVFTPNTLIDTLDFENLLSFVGTDLDIIDQVTDIADKVSTIMPINGNTQIRFAGDASANLKFKYFSLGGQYRIIESDYTSLGVYSTQQNLKSLGVNGGLRLFKNALIINGAGYGQRDNLNGKQLFTNSVNTYNLNATANIGAAFTFTAMGNMIVQQQDDGLLAVDPALRIDQTTVNLNATPSYTFSKVNDHTVSLTFSHVSTTNNNENLTSDIDSKTLSLGGAYELDMEATGLSVNGSYDYSASRSSYSDYNANTFGLGARYKLLNNDIHTISISANGSYGINNVLSQGDPNDVTSMEKRMGVAKNSNYEVVEMSAHSFDISASLSWTAKTGHSAMLRASLRNYSNRELIAQRVSTTLNANVSLSYSYSFGKKLIERKSSDSTPVLNNADEK